MWTTTDKTYMDLALQQAEQGREAGDYPVGAVLLIGATVLGSASNSIHSHNDYVSHAEASLLIAHSRMLKQIRKDEPDQFTTLYTTYEPCLMCLGLAVVHRVDRIVVACRDPRGNISSIDPAGIGPWYVQRWPKIEYGLCKDASYEMLHAYFMQRNDTDVAELFRSEKDTL